MPNQIHAYQQFDWPIHQLSWVSNQRATFECTGNHTGREAKYGQTARCFDVIATEVRQ